MAPPQKNRKNFCRSRAASPAGRIVQAFPLRDAGGTAAGKCTVIVGDGMAMFSEFLEKSFYFIWIRGSPVRNSVQILVEFSLNTDQTSIKIYS